MDYGDWRDIKGVQMAGRAAAVSNDDLPRVTELYLARFPDVRELLSAPDGRDDNAVSAKFAGSRFYVVRPLTVRYIDNTQGFGHREEFSVEEQ